jgi:amidophosphoribosyltransferase
MCGIIGVFNVSEASKYAALGLHTLQHRGQEGAGMISRTSEFHFYAKVGRVHDIFGKDEVINQLPGDMAIGHVRYSTTGGPSEANVQPLYCDLDFGGLAIAHNGNLTDSKQVRQELINNGAIFQTTTDTENILHLVAQQFKNKSPVDRLIDALQKVNGAFSIIAFINDKMIIVRDPSGYRPLCIGKFDTGYAVASESCALDIIGATEIRDVEPGEVIILDKTRVGLKDELKAHLLDWDVKKRFCIFEHIYFARPDTVFEDKLVYSVRKRIGEELAKESGVECDMIVPVPDSGVPAALGYAQQIGIPFEIGITRSHYRGRTFIQPTQSIRNLGVKLKHSAMRLFKDKSITIVDDSIVRGTTSKKIIEMARDAGAREIHMRIASPPVTGPCYYGIDTPTRKELVASSYTVEEVRQYINADTLNYLSISGLYNAVNEGNENGHCDACFTGKYPSNVSNLFQEKPGITAGS